MSSYLGEMVRGCILSDEFNLAYRALFLRLMALDIGDVRVGVAISDPTQKIASPLCILKAQDVLHNSMPFKNLVADWEPEKFVIGLPKSLDGNMNAQATKIKEIGSFIETSLGIDVEYFDERLSSAEAKNYMRESGMSERDMRGKVDAVAASIFLQTYLDSLQ